MKKLLQGILILSLFLCIPNIKAEELDNIYFTNKNNVSFTKFQYDTLVDALGLYGVLNMDIKAYNDLEVAMMDSSNTKVEVLEDYDVVEENNNTGISTLQTLYHETTYKKLTASTTCKDGYNYCILAIALQWKKNPSTRSYDVIGTRLTNTSFYDDIATVSTYMNGSTGSLVAQKRTSNGRAGAVKLSNSGNINSISLITHVKPTGRVQVSYQHAVKEVTQLTALGFDFSASGMGGVFGYPDRYVGYYDDMAGLGLVVNG